MIAPIIADKRAGTRYQHASKWGVTRSNATQNRAPCQEFWAPARTADKDHTSDHSHGGATTDDNLGNACRHDHRLKHEGGWRLHQPLPGHFRWTSRLGHSYQRRPPPILEPLPDPLGRGRPPFPLLIPTDAGWEDSEIWEKPPSERQPPPAAQLDVNQDPPPF